MEDLPNKTTTLRVVDPDDDANEENPHGSHGDLPDLLTGSEIGIRFPLISLFSFVQMPWILGTSPGLGSAEDEREAFSIEPSEIAVGVDASAFAELNVGATETFEWSDASARDGVVSLPGNTPDMVHPPSSPAAVPAFSYASAWADPVAPYTLADLPPAPSTVLYGDHERAPGTMPADTDGQGDAPQAEQDPAPVSEVEAEPPGPEGQDVDPPPETGGGRITNDPGRDRDTIEDGAEAPDPVLDDVSPPGDRGAGPTAPDADGGADDDILRDAPEGDAPTEDTPADEQPPETSTDTGNTDTPADDAPTDTPDGTDDDKADDPGDTDDGPGDDGSDGDPEDDRTEEDPAEDDDTEDDAPPSGCPTDAGGEPVGLLIEGTPEQDLLIVFKVDDTIIPHESGDTVD
ncbi:MAG: hypothetical protein AAFU49_04060, partial [Pseudomonadota bacterium]